MTNPDDLNLVTDTMLHLTKMLRCERSLDLSLMPAADSMTGGRDGYFDDRDRVVSEAFKDKKRMADNDPTFMGATPVRFTFNI